MRVRASRGGNTRNIFSRPRQLLDTANYTGDL